jgi:hypothetical protein
MSKRDQRDFIPKPPPRSSIERVIADSPPTPSLRRLSPPRGDAGHSDADFDTVRRQTPILRPSAPRSLIPSGPSNQADPKQQVIGEDRPFAFLAKALGEARERYQRASDKASHSTSLVGNQLIVPMICSLTKRSFSVRFRRTEISERWRVQDVFVVADGEANASATQATIPVNEMDWTGAQCPACHAVCGPILCNECHRLGCRGGVSGGSSFGQFYRCSCGSSGALESTLETVPASKGSMAQEPPSHSRPHTTGAASASALPALRSLPKPR